MSTDPPVNGPKEDSDAATLLLLVGNVVKNYESAAEKNGEGFNIFEILRLSSYEIHHSRIIKGLLDPKGTHGLKDSFLKAFIEIFQVKGFSQDDSEIRAVVMNERDLGPITDDYSNGGKIVTIQVEKLTGTPEKAALIDSIRFMLCLRTVEK